jgi:hypothetical protein
MKKMIKKIKNIKKTSKHKTSKHQNIKHKTSKHQNIKHKTSKHQNIKHKTSKHKTSKHKTSKHKTSKHKTVNCSPNPNNNNNFTCYSDNSLFKMKHSWNNYYPHNKINTNNPKTIWEELKNKMSNICKKESCWLTTNFMKDSVNNELLNYTFAPKSDIISKTNTWLSTLHIESVMKQYERYYKCFEFLGPSPINFNHRKKYGECVWEELCSLNLSDMIKRNKTKIGIILNTHPDYKGGEHWIAMFINIKNKKIVFFDSNGSPPPKEVTKLIDIIVKQGIQLNIIFDVLINKISHQMSNTECGMYCLYFIIEMLKDKNIEYFLKKRIPDNKVFKLRKKYFNGN